MYSTMYVQKILYSQNISVSWYLQIQLFVVPAPLETPLTHIPIPFFYICAEVRTSPASANDLSRKLIIR